MKVKTKKKNENVYNNIDKIFSVEINVRHFIPISLKDEF